MKTITKYICDFCGSEYDTEEYALRCEESHNEPAEIDGKEWMFGKKYPDKMMIEMDDGALCQYVFHREMKGSDHG